MVSKDAIEKLTHDDKERHQGRSDHRVGAMQVVSLGHFKTIREHSPQGSNPLSPGCSEKEEHEEHQETIPGRKPQR